MTNSNKTSLNAVIDRSGSMESIKHDMQGGFNAFVEAQKKEPGEATLTIAQFDTEYELLYVNKPIAEVGPYTLVPRGGTALYDAIARTIITVGEKLAALPEDERPGKVLMAIVTDGEENSSKEYRDPAQVKALIERQQNDYNWEFVFLGANIDAIAEAGKIGIPMASAMTYAASGAGAAATMDSFTTYASTVRRGAKAAFTDKDRKAAMGGDQQ